ncbi:hypothetical protein Gocc_2053 [Gaiella occulta]|uniref:SWIM-type domain-containing protein n=1 Tax=Gaiella occulta TaxID=1002870 RepID=A0A7M2YYC3_9ACTN|nr:SWIM zinc finger family protein [Gaiella occulta]RDI74477.1 hypothetical protein Gocc_2053 [Gaiella occulta]
MTAFVVDDGRPVFVAGDGDRIGRGPWARWLATAVVPEEGSARAERGRILARTGFVHSVSLDGRTIAAQVCGSGAYEYHVTLSAAPVAPRTWAALERSPRGGSYLKAALERREQPVHLAHELLVDWGARLVPSTGSLTRSCSCPDPERPCKHLAALAYVAADLVDRDPSLLLRWRGYHATRERRPAEAALATAAAEPSRDPWRAGPLPAARPVRPLPPAAVLKRLGRSGIAVGDGDLVDALAPAYDALGADGR